MIKIIPSCLKMIFEEGGIIEIIHSCLKIISKEGGIPNRNYIYICLLNKTEKM